MTAGSHLLVLNAMSDCSKVSSMLTKLCRALAALNVITSSLMQLKGASSTSPATLLPPPVSRSKSATWKIDKQNNFTPQLCVGITLI